MLRSLLLLIVGSCIWRLGTVLAEVVRYYDSATIWLIIQAAVPPCLLAIWGCWAMVRGNRQGLAAMYVSGAYCAVQGLVLKPPIPVTLLPQMGVEATSFWISSIAIFVLVIAVHCISGFRRSPAVPGRRRFQFNLRSLGLVTALLASLTNCIASQPKMEASAQSLLKSVDDHRLPSQQLAAYERVVHDYPFTDASIEALFMSGRLLEYEGREYESGARFLELLRVAPRDWRTPDESNFFRLAWEHHEACLQLSDLYEYRGDIGSALHYSLLGRDKFVYTSTCGTDLVSHDYCLRNRIEKLEDQLGVPHSRPLGQP